MQTIELEISPTVVQGLRTVSYVVDNMIDSFVSTRGAMLILFGMGFVYYRFRELSPEARADVAFSERHAESCYVKLESQRKNIYELQEQATIKDAKIDELIGAQKLREINKNLVQGLEEFMAQVDHAANQLLMGNGDFPEDNGEELRLELEVEEELLSVTDDRAESELSSNYNETGSPHWCVVSPELRLLRSEYRRLGGKPLDMRTTNARDIDYIRRQVDELQRAI